MSIDPTKLTDKLFKIKRLAYNTYDVGHPTVKGQLRVIAIPHNFFQPPSHDSGVGQMPQIGVGTQTVVGFTNRGQKFKPKNLDVSPDQLPDNEKEDITPYVANEHEPWNEFLLEGNLLVRIKTVLTKVMWIKTAVNLQGDPFLWASTNANLDASESKLGESGLV
ncbi:MAG: hypothetical protein OXI27_08960 [Thaumarchaeota archaeon]|nr:hypothetical protein [Nitrososphaerota archaeon]